jgi:hypothetical protein
MIAVLCYPLHGSLFESVWCIQSSQKISSVYYKIAASNVRTFCDMADTSNIFYTGTVFSLCTVILSIKKIMFIPICLIVCVNEIV